MSVALVVPCYNEATRLDADSFVALVDSDPSLRLLFVNDGSTDGTADVLQALRARRPDRIDVHALARNSGKAEAVRQGLLRLLGESPPPAVVGYVDADLATPVSEIQRIGAVMQAQGAQVLLASRVGLLGRQIERTAVRHYLGRVFASVASLLLKLSVYDTQCGAKLFRPGPGLQAALAEPFLSRWIFDVELLGRLLVGAPGVPPLDATTIVEEPLRFWRDVPGSKLRPKHMAGAAGDLVRVGRDLARRRRRL